MTAVRAEPGLGQALQVCALIGTAQMTWGVVVPVLPILVDDLHIPVVLLGTIIAAFAVGRVIANVPAGLALRRIPARPFVLCRCGVCSDVDAFCQKKREKMPTTPPSPSSSSS